MAKKAGSAKGNNGESTQGSFKRVLKANRQWLEGRSNDAILKKWEEDHPGEKLSNSVKSGLQNAKSMLRSKKRKRARRAAEADLAQAVRTDSAQGIRPARAKPAGHNRRHPLEALEEQIDECLTVAKMMDREGLQNVIAHLRQARNEVVWQIGQ
jgi:hypothetical protein